jgi:hypothetical protein
MSEITGRVAVHEAYAFCCMRCGHGWEQAYDIEHHVDSSGRNFVVYKAEGLRVPSPLSSPSCVNCGGHVLRIMRSGQVSSVREMASPLYAPGKKERRAAPESVPATAGAVGAEGATAEVGTPEGVGAADGTAPVRPAHHWNLFAFLNQFHHRK